MRKYDNFTRENSSYSCFGSILQPKRLNILLICVLVFSSSFAVIKAHSLLFHRLSSVSLSLIKYKVAWEACSTGEPKDSEHNWIRGLFNFLSRSVVGPF
jgi:hypothetical protein